MYFQGHTKTINEGGIPKRMFPTQRFYPPPPPQFCKIYLIIMRHLIYPPVVTGLYSLFKINNINIKYLFIHSALWAGSVMFVRSQNTHFWVS